jgi:hypothetical protein
VCLEGSGVLGGLICLTDIEGAFYGCGWRPGGTTEAPPKPWVTGGQKDGVGGEGVTSDWLGWAVACLVVAVGTSGAARDGDGQGGVGADAGGDRGGGRLCSHNHAN